MKYEKYFLGGSSPTGFKTRFYNLISDSDYYTYIIKGGPGTGKSSLMKRLADAFPDEEKEIYYCSSDPDSYDAVLFKKPKVIILDGTAPHVFDPDYPGAVQRIIDLGQYWDNSRLKANKKAIIESTDVYLQYHARCKRFITALAAITGDTVQIARSAINEKKLDSFTTRLSKKLLPKKSGSEGTIFFKQISAITPKGYLTNIPENDTIYLLNDSYMAGSDYFLRKLTGDITSKGYDAQVSLCTLHNEDSFEHLRIPELSISFLSSTHINNLILNAKNPINFQRFYDKNIIRNKKSRLRFNASAVKNLQSEAVSSLKCAKDSHDILEHYYIESVDFDSVNRLAYTLISEIKSLY